MSATDEALDIAGLEPKAEPMRYPRLFSDGTRMVLRCQVDGVDRECELTLNRQQEWIVTLANWLPRLPRS